MCIRIVNYHANLGFNVICLYSWSYLKKRNQWGQQVSVMPRVPSSTVENLADKVTKTEYGRLYLYDAIGSLTKAEATSLVRSPVKINGVRHDF